MTVPLSRCHASFAVGNPPFHQGPVGPASARATSAASDLLVVPLTPSLVPGVLRVQYAAYEPDLHETAESYFDKLQASPGTSFVAICPTQAQSQPLRKAKAPQHGEINCEAAVVGYAVSLAVPRFFLPALDSATTTTRLAEACVDALESEADSSSPTAEDADGELGLVDTLYLHDVAVDPAFRGRRVAGHLLRQAERKRTEMGLRRMALIAVRGADKFWKKVGFEPVDRRRLPSEVAQKLEGYGADAVYMEKVSSPARTRAVTKRSSL